MGRFLDAAQEVLESEGRPLSPEEITALALDRGALQTQGSTPSQTMKSKLSTDILHRRDASPFMRADENLFALRQWKPNIPEYHAPRYKKALLDEMIAVFPKSILRNYVPEDGLTRPAFDSQALLMSCYPMLRREAEQDTTVVQLVSVFIVRHQERYLTYKRSKRLPEKRLHGEYSLHFGGHLNPEDAAPLLDIFVPDLGLPLLERELDEELAYIEDPFFEFRGLLYDSSRAVSSQHLGVVYDVSLGGPRYEIGERGFLIDPRWESKDEIWDRLADFENWSVILLEADKPNSPIHAPRPRSD